MLRSSTRALCGFSRPLSGHYLFMKQKYPEHKAAVLKANPTLNPSQLFKKTKSEVMAEWAKMPETDRIAQGYWKKLEGDELARMEENLKKKKERVAAGGSSYAKKTALFSKKSGSGSGGGGKFSKFTKKFSGGNKFSKFSKYTKSKGTKAYEKNAAKRVKGAKREPQGVYLYTKHQYPEYKASILKENPNLTPKEVFEKAKAAIVAAWQKMPDEDKKAQGYWEELEKSEGASKKPSAEAKEITGYNKFIKEKSGAVHATVKVENPTMSAAERFSKANKQIIAMWKELTTEQRVAEGYYKKKE